MKGKLIKSNSVLVCMRFRIHLYVVALAILLPFEPVLHFLCPLCTCRLFVQALQDCGFTECFHYTGYCTVHTVMRSLVANECLKITS
jgi:hypothetical protein